MATSSRRPVGVTNPRGRAVGQTRLDFFFPQLPQSIAPSHLQEIQFFGSPAFVYLLAPSHYQVPVGIYPPDIIDGSVRPDRLVVPVSLYAPELDTNILPSHFQNSPTFGTPTVVAASSTFNITLYGADNTGVLDSTAGIQAAIDAASAYAIANPTETAAVYIPTGTYKVIPPGSAYVTLYEKNSGSWGTALVSYQASDQVVSGTGSDFYLQDSDPASEGSDGDHWFNYRKGTFYRRTGGAWWADGKLMDYGGVGVAAQATNRYVGYTATIDKLTYWVVPDNAMGSNGDWAVMFEVKYDKSNGACFELTQDHNRVYYLGDGDTLSELSFSCWSDEDPMDYELDGTTILSAAVPLVRNSSGEGFYKRGSLFVMKTNGTSALHEDIQWRDLKLNGNTTGSGSNNWYTPYGYLNEWDITNKCIVFSFGSTNMTDLVVQDCDLVGWRGEILYGGGSNNKYITIWGCTIHDTNSSAISISGQTTILDCSVYDFYNGLENYCDGTQYTIIDNSTFDADSTAKGYRGFTCVAYIGDGTSQSLHIRNNTVINGAQSMGIFLSESAQGATIQDTTITDCTKAIRLYYINMSPYFLTPNYSNLTINNVDVIADSRDLTFGLEFSQNMIAENWNLTDFNIIGQNGYTVTVGIRDVNTGSNGHDVTMTNCDFSGAETGINGNGVCPDFVSGNVMPIKALNPYTYPGAEYPLQAQMPEYYFSYIPDPVCTLGLGDLTRYPDGFTLTFGQTSAARDLTIYQSQSWNSFTQDYVLDRYDSITMQFNYSTQKFDFVSFNDEDYAP